jgi:hypothetical protein
MTVSHTEFSMGRHVAFQEHYMECLELAGDEIIMIMYSLTHEGVVALLIRKAERPSLSGDGLLQVYVILDWHVAHSLASMPAVEALVRSRVHVRVNQNSRGDAVHPKVRPYVRTLYAAAL